MSDKYGCHNRAPFKATLTVQDGWAPAWGGSSRMPIMKEIPFRNTPECVYTTSDLGRVDAKCKGCRWAADLVQASADGGAT